MLDVIRHQHPNLECGTTLNLGPETELAGLCAYKGIPFTSILSCNDQGDFWDKDKQTIFEHLLRASSSAIFITQEPYRPGAEKLQQQELTNWLAKDNQQTVLLIRDGPRSPRQTEIIREIGLDNIREYNFTKEKLYGRY